MARITVEDCLDQLPNRFSLVLVAAERAKQIARGSQSLIENDEANKEIVMALREIAAGKFLVDHSDVVAHDEWLPRDRQRPVADTDLPPAADELPPEA